MKAKLYFEPHGTIMIKCPAGHDHYINTLVPNHKGAIWSWNGNFESPTFTPSINEKSGFYADGYVPEQEDIEFVRNESYICHFIITDGMISFCADCTHDLKGQTLPLLEI